MKHQSWVISALFEVPPTALGWVTAKITGQFSPFWCPCESRGEMGNAFAPLKCTWGKHRPSVSVTSENRRFLWRYSSVSFNSGFGWSFYQSCKVWKSLWASECSAIGQLHTVSHIPQTHLQHVSYENKTHFHHKSIKTNKDFHCLRIYCLKIYRFSNGNFIFLHTFLLIDQLSVPIWWAFFFFFLSTWITFLHNNTSFQTVLLQRQESKLHKYCPSINWKY